MNKFAITTWIKDAAHRFARDDEGAQILEYALIVAVVSIGLILLMTTASFDFTKWVETVKTCLTTGTCTR